MILGMGSGDSLFPQHKERQPSFKQLGRSGNVDLGRTVPVKLEVYVSDMPYAALGCDYRSAQNGSSPCQDAGQLMGS